MRNKLLLLSLCCGSLAWAGPTEDPVIMKVNGKDVTKAEFEYIYRKNNQQQIDNKSLDDYLVLFKNFKLKVSEAESMGLDTTSVFKTELEGYRKQLANPYLVDRQVDDQLALEAYNRLKENVEVSHILFRIPENATPADTFKIYQKADSVLNLIRKGQDFATLAKQYSEDPSAARNAGYLGFITGFMTVYPFESAAYNTPAGSVTGPVRSQFGYHLVKVSSRRSDPGQVLTAHIMKASSPNAPEEQRKKAEQEIREIYDQIMQGGDFAAIAKEKSDDPGSAQKGGELPWFGSGRMVKEFEDVAFSLKEKGDISAPVLSPFGWHIVKLLDRKQLEPFSEKKAELLRRIARDERGNKGQLSLIEKLKKEYNLTLNQPVVDRMVKLTETYNPKDSVFMTKIEEDSETLLTINGQPYAVSDFAVYLKKQFNAENMPAADYLNDKINAFAGKSILDYEDSQLESKYADFRNLMNEYRDGILLFEVSNREVWDKASKDTQGLSDFFKKNKKKYNWKEPRYKGYVVSCKNDSVASLAKVKIASYPQDSVVYYLQKEFNNDSIKNVKVEKGLYLKGDNQWVDQAVFTIGSPAVNEDFPVVFVSGKLLKKGPESYQDVRGLVTADYQNYLENRWIKALNKKYPVEINKDVVKTVNNK